MSGFISHSNNVPPADSALNTTINQVLGNKTDTHDGDSIRAVLHILNEHTHKASNVWPTGAAGKVVATAFSDDWALGVFTEIAAANDIGIDFDIHFINIEGISTSGVFELVLYAVEVEIARFRFTVVGTPNNLKFNPIPIQTAIIPANTQIQAKLMSSNSTANPGDTATISFSYHIY